MKDLMCVVILIVLQALISVTGTPLKVSYCFQYGTTSETNTNNQLNPDNSDDYENYDEPVDPSDDVFIDKNMSTVVACSRYATFCYALWTFDATKNTTKVVVQGCWELSDKKESCNTNECISHKETKSGHFFCCCSGDNCNGNFSFASTPAITDGISLGTVNEYTPFAPYTSIWSSPTVYICFAMVGIILMLIIGFLTCRKTTKTVSELAPLAPSGPGYSSNLYNVDNLKLVAMIGQGRYGTVWKGVVNEQHVAVKIFTAQHRQYFLNEKDIYTIPLMESPSLLTYFGCDERRTMDDRIEYLIVLSLAPLGCLQDWLTDNRMHFNIFCKMAKSIASGVAHLHTEIRKGDLIKPCVCHRDLNSRNILVKADLSCCICDLGFALKTFGPRYESRGEIALAETKSINEVGTLRYMAPEVLEGAVNLRDCESALKQIDVYSLGLVMWELSTRCSDFYPDEVFIPEYRAPYEEEVGTNPSFEQMQVLVSRNKARPRFPLNYESSVAVRIVQDTCEECWDHDAEARLTALCVQERIQEITTMNPKAQLHKGQTPPLSTNNLIITTPTVQTRISPTAVSFMAPPNQQVIPHSNHPCDTTNGSTNYSKVMNVPPNSLKQIIPQGSLKHNINEAYIPDEEDKFKSLTGDQQPSVMFRNPRGLPKLDNNETQRKIKGLNSVKAMLQKTFQKTNPYVQQDCDDKSNLVDNSIKNKTNSERSLSDLVSSNTNSVHIKMINDADNDIEKRSAERPNNLDLSSGSGRYEHNLIRSANENSKFKVLTDDFTSQPFTIVQSSSPNPKLRIVVSKSANAVKNLNSSCDENKFIKRQRSLEVFQEVFGPKGSIERLRNPSQRVKTPGDVPPSVRKVRASKTLSLYDDRMMDTSRIANTV
ncbi:bone morphogenetic protein receptor type-2 [Toxorhynchites rutilus septentrionalis]|uniref:bone morphogenetic protein receptor type-2 n=1 Tax=Toxorhynchites rutilus septentrionalis TaxID=329112 RepID=UPI0024798A94|nr:bone morphogenetic protein receptor type-2 [Toxorhynchites rutilus septentrionalis]XP_055625802.1 bone morphogenetic protein receptor type-2 [Toxorhynchites rutilus septentrionalis]XP_055625803.1 bone morphogenetic protein receptor type-2 [Toxorhynchites rutilus septentrionalis]XP_055625804.1 bone morphogenetic protein receptor type-2 [Toxorhynchites rutilus septentrionalis]XP_055625805.1 bone morphogenetic protein receptor type-2 [Toxorhynchites rutilus septentrionalis]XP_055625806.1 bone 